MSLGRTNVQEDPMQHGMDPSHHNGMTMGGRQRHSSWLGHTGISGNMMLCYREQSGQNGGRPECEKNTVPGGRPCDPLITSWGTSMFSCLKFQGQ